MTFRYLHDCGGIHACGPAWDEFGWECVGMTEIEKFPIAVVKHHYPNLTQYGDTTKLKGSDLTTRIDLLVGGTPCQDFSLSRVHKSGTREGMDGDNSRLARNFIRLIDELEPEPPAWVIWENVIGSLSSNRGRDMGAFVRELEKRDYGVCGRVLDAQYFGSATRRKRMFIVARLGDWRPAAAVLFDSKCIPPLFNSKQARGDTLPNLKRESGGLTLERLSHLVFKDGIIRPLTTLERERAMGFPDNYTKIACATYRKRNDALGNSIAVPVLRHLGQRIQIVEQILTRRQND